MIYVLELENNKYYVGYTTNISQRIESHFNGSGCSWTKYHKPIKLLETRDGGKSVEKQVTLEYMRRYGWENVRGYAYTAVILSGKPRCI